MFCSQNYNASSRNKCSSCGWEDDPVDEQLSILAYRAHHHPDAVADYLRDMFIEKIRIPCPDCTQHVDKISMFHKLPKLLAFSIGDSEVHINNSLKIREGDNCTKFWLRGVVYLGEFHFTARMITNDRGVWFHDGQTSARQCYFEKHLKEFQGDELNICDGKEAVMAIYSQK
jgi:hypothetical protein